MMRRLLCAVCLSLTISCFAADDTAARPGDSPKVDGQSAASQKPPPPPEAPPKKTEYDKLPLPELLSKAKAQDLTAQFELASRFNYGRGVPKNTAEALRWLRRAASAGQEDAARLLAVKLYNGHDVVPDFAESMKWARQLAESGDIPAQLMLASMYINGEGTRRDLKQAYMWYAIAAVGAKRDGVEEEPKAEQIQAAMTERDKLASLLSDEEESEAQKMASEWWMAKYATPKQKKQKAKSLPGQ